MDNTNKTGKPTPSIEIASSTTGCGLSLEGVLYYLSYKYYPDHDYKLQQSDESHRRQNINFWPHWTCVWPGWLKTDCYTFCGFPLLQTTILSNVLLSGYLICSAKSF
jgi:hypothetical protein